MKIEREMRYDVSAVNAYEMQVTKAYQELKCRDVGARSYDVTISQAGDGAVVRINRTLPSDGFAAVLRKLMPHGITTTETVTWGAAASDGSRTAELLVAFHGSPANLKGTIRIVAAGPDTSDVFVDADFKAHVPLIGGKVEKAAAPIVIGVIDGEEVTAKGWIGGRR